MIAPRHAFPARHRLANPAAPALHRKKLPVGIQTLAKLRCQGCCYVDKSGLAIDLIESGSYFFLSRPRRFGKSLVVDTFKELFEGAPCAVRETGRRDALGLVAALPRHPHQLLRWHAEEPGPFDSTPGK